MGYTSRLFFFTECDRQRTDRQLRAGQQRVGADFRPAFFARRNARQFGNERLVLHQGGENPIEFPFGFVWFYYSCQVTVNFWF